MAALSSVSPTIDARSSPIFQISCYVQTKNFRTVYVVEIFDLVIMILELLLSLLR